MLTLITAFVLFLVGAGSTAPSSPGHPHGGGGKIHPADCVVQPILDDCQ